MTSFEHQEPDYWERGAPPVAVRGERVVPGAARPSKRRRAGGGGSTTAVVLIVVIVVLLAAAGGGGWFMLNRLGISPMSLFAGGGQAPVASRPIATSTAADFKSTPGNAIGPGATVDGVQTILIASKQRSPSPAGTTEGVYYPLPAAVVAEMAGKTVRVVITARAATTNPTQKFAAAYAGEGANTGWMVFTPTTSFQPYALMLRVPQANQAAPANVGIWSDVSGQGKVLEVKSVTVELAR